MKKLMFALLAVALLATPAAAALDGSAHDLVGKAGMGETRMCVFCHTPHFALNENDGSAANYYPLWNRMDSFEAYTMYDSLSMDSTPAGTPQGPSKLCLSCHDGSIAVDEYGFNFGTTFIDAFTGATNDYNINIDGMQNDHPVGVDYASARATDTELRATTDSGPAGVTVDTLLWSGYVECSSCHDVHNKNNYAKLLTVDDWNNSDLCTTCHAK